MTVNTRYNDLCAPNGQTCFSLCYKVLHARKDEDRDVNHGVQFEEKPHKVTIKCCFPLAEARKKRKTFFSHTSGSLGASVRGV